MLVIQVSLCYILKQLEDKKALSVHIYYTCCDVILISKCTEELGERGELGLRLVLIHSLKIRVTSRPCNKYEQITLSYLLNAEESDILRTIDNGLNRGLFNTYTMATMLYNICKS